MGGRKRRAHTRPAADEQLPRPNQRLNYQPRRRRRHCPTVLHNGESRWTNAGTHLPTALATTIRRLTVCRRILRRWEVSREFRDYRNVDESSEYNVTRGDYVRQFVTMGLDDALNVFSWNFGLGSGSEVSKRATPSKSSRSLNILQSGHWTLATTPSWDHLRPDTEKTRHVAVEARKHSLRMHQRVSASAEIRNR